MLIPYSKNKFELVLVDSMGYRIFSKAYGCASNFADYEIALGLLKKAGFELVDDAKNSDLNIIFTCTVKLPTLNRMIHRIRELTELNKPLIIAGCMPKTEREIIEKINPEASMIGPDSIEKIVDVARATIQGRKVVFLEDLRRPKLCLPRISRNPVIRITQIAEGCAWRQCSYCSVRFARGKLFSYPIGLIVRDIEQGLKGGSKEVWICSQDTGCYGLDIGVRLPYLLNEIVKISGKFLIRVGMMNPIHVKDILNELIEAYKNEKIFKFLHLPVQSGSDKILKLMNRGYEVKDFIKIIEKFEKEFPFITISTDIIAGFPQETEEDFDLTLKLIEKIKPDIVNISKFGPRPKTEAAKMKQLPVNIVNKRSKQLHELVKAISFDKNQRWLNWEGEILIDERGKKDTWIGRNFAYKPVVVKSGKNLLGKFVKVKITEAKSNYLIGKINF